VVGIAASRPRFNLAAAEVDRLIETSLSHLREPATVQWQQRTRQLPPGGMMNVPYFHVDGAQVWGATAMVLAEMLAVLAEVEAEPTSL
jgi:hypothetical protein